MLAVLTAMRVLCFAVAALFVVLAARGLFDADVALRGWQSLLGAGAFVLTGFACGFLRRALGRHSGRDSAS